MSDGNVKWYKFAGGPITYWGEATEAQAQAYAKMRSRRYPASTYVDVAGDPGDEASTIVNVGAMLGIDNDAA